MRRLQTPPGHLSVGGHARFLRRGFGERVCGWGEGFDGQLGARFEGCLPSFLPPLFLSVHSSHTHGARSNSLAGTAACAPSSKPQTSSRFLMRCLSPRSPRRLVVRASTAPSPPIVFSTSSTLLRPSFLPAPSSQILLKIRREEEPGEGAGVLLTAFCVKNATPGQSALPADRLQHTSSTLLLLLLPSFPRQRSKILLKISKTKFLSA